MHFKSHQTNFLLEKCQKHPADAHLLTFYCRLCRKEFCNLCLKDHSNVHPLCSVEELWNETLNKFNYKTLNDMQYDYCEMIKNFSLQIKAINELINTLIDIKKKFENFYDKIQSHNKFLMNLSSIVFYSFFSSKSFSSIFNLQKIKPRFDCFKEETKDIEHFLISIKNTIVIHNFKNYQFKTSPFLFEITEQTFASTTLTQPSTHYKKVLYKNNKLFLNCIQFFEEKSFNPFTQSISQLNDGKFIYVDKNKFVIKDIFNSLSSEEINLLPLGSPLEKGLNVRSTRYSKKITPQFQLLNLSSKNLIGLCCGGNFLLLNLRTMKFEKEISLAVGNSQGTNVYIIKAIELTEETVAILGSDFTLRTISLSSNADPIIVFKNEGISFDMIKLPFPGHLAISSNEKIKIIDTDLKICLSEWKNSNGNVNYKQYVQYLYLLKERELVASDNHGTTFWDMESKEKLRVFADVKTRFIFELPNSKLMLFNGADITRIYSINTQQIITTIYVEGNIVTWFRLCDDRVGYAGTKGVKILN